MDDHRRNLYDMARNQRGLLTRADLTSLGITKSERARLRRIGALVPVGRQTFEVGGLPPDVRRTWLRACLDTGGVLSHRSAAALHGLEVGGAAALPEVLLRRRGMPRDSQLAIMHSTTWLPLDDVTRVDGIPCTTVARTLLCLAALSPPIPADAVRGAVDDAIRSGRATDAWLWWRLERLRCRGRSGVALFEAILTARAGGEATESWLERELLRLADRFDLPLPVCQRRIAARGAFVARVDFLYDQLDIVIEVTGAKGHSTREQRAADARRRNKLALLGYLVLEFTYEQVVGQPEQVAEQIREAIESRVRFAARASAS